MGRKRGGAGVSASGSGRRGRSTSSVASSARKRRSSRRSSAAATCPLAEPRPAADLGHRGGAEPAQVLTHHLDPGVSFAELRLRADPALGVGEQVGAAAIPGARRRNPHQLEPEAEAVDTTRALADELVNLGPAQRLAGEPRFDPAGRGGHLASGRLSAQVAQPPLSSLTPDTDRERPPLRGGEQMDGGAQRGSLDDGAPLQRPVERRRSKSSSRDQSPMYIEGAYCAWIPAIRSSAFGSVERPRSSSIWRASSARLSCCSLSTRSATHSPLRCTDGPPGGIAIRPRIRARTPPPLARARRSARRSRGPGAGGAPTP